MTAITKEVSLQQEYLSDEPVETIYFGGGTPSLLTVGELALILETIRTTFKTISSAEVTLETNPDDIDLQKLKQWKQAGINRLSIGVQSFFDKDLAWMNRAHTAGQAISSLRMATGEFENITADLIYGIPGLSDEQWNENVHTLTGMGIPHLSCYALTVEPKTPLDKLIRLHKKEAVDPDKQSSQFLLLMDWMTKMGYEHYEISNFAKPGFRSRHNSSYWQGKVYLGLGPSAHSYNGSSRQWNTANNSIYMNKISEGVLPFEKEELTGIQQLNEYIMTSLRTIEGLDLSRFPMQREEIMVKAGKYIDKGLISKNGDSLTLSAEGKLLADGIAAALFF